ncbi:hypothetical protein L4X63_00195 [Geomonas sp. Red32]|uniref:hypothetical protein n=1 Tax=Geomonas sp. Red32 TaxID=2912856 RepID=UPI00202CD9ED|nr:hypothetical protein [Geomonas sp. Red32]MCM0080001.1 hypothetical protein [Geomonas sp. Red32]
MNFKGNFWYVFIALTFSIFAFGCATTPVPSEEATLVPSNQIHDNRYLQEREGTGEVIVKRDKGFLGSGCFSKVYIDAIFIAYVDPAEKVVLFLPEGDHLVGAEPNSICGGGLSESKASVTKGKKLVFRIGYGSNGDYHILPTAF